MSDIDYSIIIPHYNIPDLLQRALDSIPQREDIEVIIVDDNSNPSIVDFARFPGLDRPNTQCIFLKKNGGAGIARNTAISLAKGKWILCVDADDFLLDGAFEAIDKYRNSDSDVVVFKADSCMSDDINKKGERNNAAHLNILIDECIDEKIQSHEILYRILSPWCKLVKRQFLAEHYIQFDETSLGGEDVIWSTNIAIHSKFIKVSSEYIYKLTERTDSLSSQIGYKAVKNIIKVFNKKNKLLHRFYIYKYDSYPTYEILYKISNNNKWDYIRIVFWGIWYNVLEPKQYFKLERTLFMRYPYIYLLFLLLDGKIWFLKQTTIRRKLNNIFRYV